MTACVAAAPAEASASSVVRADGYSVREIDTGPLGVAHPSRVSASARGTRLVVSSATRSRGLDLLARPVGARRGPRGLGTTAAVNPGDGLTYTLSGRQLVGRGRRGARKVISLRDVWLVQPRALAFARSGDRTDSPHVWHPYIADADGRIVEIGIDTRSVSASAAAVSTQTGRILRTIATAGWAPSSPDPSGVTYDPANKSLIVADSEVEETPLYQGVNLWTAPLASLNGVGSGTTFAYSKEPTGLSLNPADRTLYIADDDGVRFIVDKPGVDGRHGTADDVVTKVGVAPYGVTDAEDVAYDTRTGHLWICDGIGREIWDINPVNGVFGDAGDQVKHFDLARYGLQDCEGVALDTARNTVLVVDPLQKYIFEFTTTGSLSRRIDLRAIPGDNVMLAAVTMAPSSSTTDSSSNLSYFLTDRHVDNGPDPSENDGRLYEVTTRNVSSDSPPSVSVTQPAAGATVSGTVTVGASATDSRGVTSVRFRVDNTDIGVDTSAAGGWSVPWDTTKVGNGPHSVTAVATDTAGNTSAAAPRQVTVSNIVSGTLSVAVRVGNDDADETSDGAVRLAIGDLELGSDHGVATTVALRFSGLGIPRGATIGSASVQFNADELDRAEATDTIRAEAADNSAGLTGTAFNLSSRPVTAASALWSVPTWTVFGAAGPEQQTPDLAAIIQEVVNRPGWAPGNALTLLITGTGRRTAESFEGGFPPILNVEFAMS